MKITKLIPLVTALSAASVEAADLISNGGFESGLAGWTSADQIGSEGTFLLQAGTSSPLNGFAVPVPPEGASAAMTDAAGPGSHVLYQDFVVPTSVASASLGFSLFVGNRADAFSKAAHLDFATPALNQQARVDIVTTTAGGFSIAPGDVLENFFMTPPGDLLISGYTDFAVDITSLLQAHAGETLRLRFAEVDNVNTFNFGVDKVSISLDANPVPDSTTGLALVPLALCLASALFQSAALRKQRLA